MTKFGFTIRTRDGSLVDNLTIQGRDQVEAESKLRQVYHHCKVVDVRVIAGAEAASSTDLEGLITLIASPDRKP